MILDELIHAIRGFQQFSAALAAKSNFTPSDAREDEASLDLLDPSSKKV